MVSVRGDQLVLDMNTKVTEHGYPGHVEKLRSDEKSKALIVIAALLAKGVGRVQLEMKRALSALESCYN
jgi:hypothetical protein